MGLLGIKGYTLCKILWEGGGEGQPGKKNDIRSSKKNEKGERKKGGKLH